MPIETELVGSPQEDLALTQGNLAQIESEKKFSSLQNKIVIVGATLVAGAICGLSSWSLVVPYAAIDYFVNHIATAIILSDKTFVESTERAALLFVSKNIVNYSLLCGLGFTDVAWLTVFAVDLISSWIS